MIHFLIQVTSMRLIQAFVVTGLVLSATFVSGAETKPNIILLFSDDAGYADFGFHDSVVMQTPNLDRLAESGTRLTQFYVSASVCGPSRAGLMTGRYQQRFGFEENNVPPVMSPSSQQLDAEMGMPTTIPTLGQVLQQQGYRTGIFGKWHLGYADRYHPLRRGFDTFVGFRGGARSFFAYPNPDRAQRENLLERQFAQYQEPKDYLTDVLADATCDFIRENQDRPFFAFVSFNAVHLPLQADRRDRDAFPELSGDRRTLAQMNLSMDRACGQIMKQLEDLGLSQNTLIVFSNDNGGPSDKNASNNFPFAGVKATHLEGGIRVPGLIAWPGKVPAGETFNDPAITLDLLPTFVAAAGGDPESIDGLDGVNLLPYLQGKKQGRPHQTLYWKKETRGTIRDGDWKLMRFPDRPAQLFDLANDPGEQNDLAAKHPDKVRELFQKLFDWEVGLERPLFMLRPEEEAWSAERFDQFRVPPTDNR
ncbi:sulfatase-like hydrolase/transferase [Crateriforma spongiae]|uniref:sulfatase-like hydrolase/transferase n=1 Tax=Crateriforma spongiae TaxID=2724528 RepID=UPI001F193B8F|nr:sulfatase-like hydrolase/transferase [Crateriforma spongiae]